jgi:hypothetical protein
VRWCALLWRCDDSSIIRASHGREVEEREPPITVVPGAGSGQSDEGAERVIHPKCIQSGSAKFEFTHGRLPPRCFSF